MKFPCKAVCLGTAAVLSMTTSPLAQAGTGWYVTIINNDREVLSINFAGNDNWYCNDFCVNQKLNPMTQRTFYTEEKATDFNKSGIQGIDMNGVHVEFYQDDHAHSNTEAVLTGLYKIVAHNCKFHVGAGVSTSNPSLTRITINGGSEEYCDGLLGTVYVTIEYKPKPPAASNQEAAVH